jgi:phage-related protein (TIGR01555 family)
MRLLNSGWGDSIFVRIASELRDFDVVWGSAAVLMNDFAQSVYKIKGLAEILGSDGEGALVARMRAIDLMRSTVRAILIDSEEEFGRQQTPVAGLPEILERFTFRLAAAAEMPCSMLFGQAPAGLNATGDADIRFYYDHLKNRQTRQLKPALERLVRMLMQGREPAQWSIMFRPLWQLTEGEQATAHLAQANADKVYLDARVLSPEEVRQSRFGDHYSVDTTLIEDEAPEPLPELPPVVMQAPPVPPSNGQNATPNPA